MKKAERFRKEIVLLFPVFLVFPDKALGKSGNFLFPIFAYYTTTREKGELRRNIPTRPYTRPYTFHYTTTRENREVLLRLLDIGLRGNQPGNNQCCPYTIAASAAMVQERKGKYMILDILYRSSRENRKIAVDFLE